MKIKIVNLLNSFALKVQWIALIFSEVSNNPDFFFLLQFLFYTFLKRGHALSTKAIWFRKWIFSSDNQIWQSRKVSHNVCFLYGFENLIFCIYFRTNPGIQRRMAFLFFSVGNNFAICKLVQIK